MINIPGWKQQRQIKNGFADTNDHPFFLTSNCHRDVDTAGTSALAASCGSGSFDAWLSDFKTEAAAKGISQNAITAGLNGVALDQSVLSRDRSQKVFSQSFEEFSGRMVPPRLLRGSNMLKQYGSVLSRIEQSYGVPGEVLVAIWGLLPCRGSPSSCRSSRRSAWPVRRRWRIPDRRRR